MKIKCEKLLDCNITAEWIRRAKLGIREECYNVYLLKKEQRNV